MTDNTQKLQVQLDLLEKLSIANKKNIDDCFQNILNIFNAIIDDMQCCGNCKHYACDNGISKCQNKAWIKNGGFENEKSFIRFRCVFWKFAKTQVKENLA